VQINTPAAPTTICLYGVLDAYMEVGWNGVENVNRMQSGGLQGTRLGFKGNQELTRDSKLIFDLEMGVNVDQGTSGQGGATFGRQAWVGVTGPWGTLTGGRQYSPEFIAMVTYGLGSGMAWGNASNYFADASSLRVNNALLYVSPKLAGLTFKALYSFTGWNSTTNQPTTQPDTTTPSRQNVGHFAGVTGQYDHGPLSVNLSHMVRKTTATNQDKWSVGGASWDFKVVKAGLLYQRHTDDLDLTRNQWWELNAYVPVGKDGLLLDAGSFRNLAMQHANALAYSVRYDHNWTAQATLYAGFATIRNGSKAAFGINGATGTALAVAPAACPRSIIAGFRYAF
jgi:predicted porin